MTGLGVNIDHVATLRQARRTVEPDPIWAAAEAELGGASCITFHLRKDRRHINDRDARLLRQTVRAIKLNMEMSLDEEIVQIALELRPDQATLVPENRQEITTEGGLDCLGGAQRLKEVTGRLQQAGIVVSAFIDPDQAQIQAVLDAGCEAIELHTGRYANAFLAAIAYRKCGEGILPADNATSESLPAASERGGMPAQRISNHPVELSLEHLQTGKIIAMQAGLEVHAGHGLTYANVARVAKLADFGEFNIGHSIISRSVFVGLRQAVREMRDLIEKTSG